MRLADAASPSGMAASRTPWPTVLLVVGAGIVGAFQAGKVPVALPALRGELGMGLAAAGWVLSIFNVVGMLLGMTMGAVVARFGPRRLAIAGLLLLALASAAGAAATGAAVLLASRLVEGFGFLMVIVAAPSLVVRLARPEHLKLAFGLWGAYMPAGQALMMIASPGLLAAAGWRGLWLANAVLLALYAAALAWATRGAERPVAGGSASAGLLADLRETATAPGPFLLALAFATYSLQYLAVVGFLPTIFVEHEGLSTTSAGLLGALVIAANVVGNVGAGILLHHGLPRWALIGSASLVMGLCGIGIFAAGLPFWPAYGLAVLFSAVGGMLPATVLGGAPAFAPAPRLVPVANGLMVQGSNLGQVAGPPAVGALAAAVGGWQWTPLVLSSSAAAGIAVALLLRRLERRRAAG